MCPQWDSWSILTTGRVNGNWGKVASNPTAHTGNRKADCRAFSLDLERSLSQGTAWGRRDKDSKGEDFNGAVDSDRGILRHHVAETGQRVEM